MALKGRGINFDRLKFEHLYATYLGMSPREQTIALVGVIGAMLLVLILPVLLASGNIRSLERNIRNSQKDFKAIMTQIDSHNAHRAELDALERSLAGGYDSSIATTLETLAGRSGIKDRIDALKEKPGTPSEVIEQVSVDVRLKKVKLDELISFLYEIENHPVKILKLDKLDVKPRYDNKKEFDASFTVTTFRLR